MSSESPAWIYLMIGISSIALAVAMGMLAPQPVQADARIPQAALTGTAAFGTTAPLAASATPATLAAQTPEARAVMDGRKDRLRGIASWYGGVFNGRKTASGERFNMYAMTACHPTLPFGSLVRVFNLSNHRSVVVRITDRGDLVDEGRIIDVSYGAAQQLAMTKSGLAKVDLKVISLGRGHPVP